MTTMRMLTTLAAVTAAFTVTSGTVAQAGHYRAIDDHAREIAYEAGRSESIVKYNFRNAPVGLTRCLEESLCEMKSTAECVRDLTRHDGHLREIEQHLGKLRGQYAHTRAALNDLHVWFDAAPCCATTRTDEFQLKRLCERVSEIGEELDHSLADLAQLTAPVCHTHTTVTQFQPVIVPHQPVTRVPVAPAPTIHFGINRGSSFHNVSPVHHGGFGSRFSTPGRVSSHDRHDDHRDDHRDSHRDSGFRNGRNDVGFRSGGVSFSLTLR